MKRTRIFRIGTERSQVVKLLKNVSPELDTIDAYLEAPCHLEDTLATQTVFFLANCNSPHFLRRNSLPLKKAKDLYDMVEEGENGDIVGVIVHKKLPTLVLISRINSDDMPFASSQELLIYFVEMGFAGWIEFADGDISSNFKIGENVPPYSPVAKYPSINPFLLLSWEEPSAEESFTDLIVTCRTLGFEEC